MSQSSRVPDVKYLSVATDSIAAMAREHEPVTNEDRISKLLEDLGGARLQVLVTLMLCLALTA